MAASVAAHIRAADCHGVPQIGRSQCRIPPSPDISKTVRGDTYATNVENCRHAHMRATICATGFLRAARSAKSRRVDSPCTRTHASRTSTLRWGRADGSTGPPDRAQRRGSRCFRNFKLPEVCGSRADVFRIRRRRTVRRAPRIQLRSGGSNTIFRNTVPTLCACLLTFGVRQSKLSLTCESNHYMAQS